MLDLSTGAGVSAREIDGHPRPSGKIADKNVRAVVKDVCRAIWPEKTDACVAAICDCDPRQVRRYFKGEQIIPSVLLAAINNKLVGIE